VSSAVGLRAEALDLAQQEVAASPFQSVEHSASSDATKKAVASFARLAELHIIDDFELGFVKEALGDPEQDVSVVEFFSGSEKQQAILNSIKRRAMYFASNDEYLLQICSSQLTRSEKHITSATLANAGAKSI